MGGGMQGWQRPEEPIAQQRTRKPLEAPERYRWLAGYQGAGKGTPACPPPFGVNGADRAGDIQEWLVDARRREPPQRAEGSIRATGQRRLAPGAAQR
jgi:hypothetical protein